MTPPPSRSARLELLVVLAALAAATLAAWTTRLDLAAGDLFRAPCCSWPLAERQPWAWLYRYGVMAGVLLAAGAMVAFTLSYWMPGRLLAWRRPALFLVLAAALGPGLTVNVIFKDHYGRPRPREVVELGGQERFLPVWVPGSDRQAKSFPCGHCAIGFYLSTPWLVLRRRRRGLAWGFLGAGLAWGGLLGLARMMAGGHFLSDVVWAAGMTWLVALLLHRLLRPEDPPPAPTPESLAAERGKARLVTVVGGLALAGLTAAALVATPYLSQKTWRRSAAEVAAGAAPGFAVVIDQATVSLEAGSELEATYEVAAFGFPTSRLNWKLTEGPEEAALAIDPHGFFSERRTTVALRWPAGGVKPLRLEIGKGKVRLDLTGFAPEARLAISVGEGEVRVKGAGALRDGRVTLRVAKGQVVEE